MSEGLTQRELLDMFDRTAAYPEIRAAIRRILKPEEAPDPAGLRERIQALPMRRNGSPVHSHLHGADPDLVSRAEVLALVDDAALDTPAPLDEAWAEAEAALPEGWFISQLIAPLQAAPSRWSAIAAPKDWKDDTPSAIGHGATPAAALRALAARLAATDEGSGGA